MLLQTKIVKDFIKKFNLIDVDTNKFPSVKVQRRYIGKGLNGKAEYEWTHSESFIDVPYSKWLELIELSENEFKNAEEKDKWIYRSVDQEDSAYLKKEGGIEVHPSRYVLNHYAKDENNTYPYNRERQTVTIRVRS